MTTSVHRIDALAPLAPKITEAQFQLRVIMAAILYGWMVFHPLPAHTSKGHRTPTQGHTGYPDLTMARNGVVLIVELKLDTTYPSPEQRAWHAAMGEHVQVWRPRDWDTVILPALQRPPWRRNGTTPQPSGGTDA